MFDLVFDPEDNVSTHSRLKAAVIKDLVDTVTTGFNTQPPEGGCGNLAMMNMDYEVSTHSRLKAAATTAVMLRVKTPFQHTAA